QVTGSVSTTAPGVPRVCRVPATHCTAPYGGTRTSTLRPGALAASALSPARTAVARTSTSTPGPRAPSCTAAAATAARPASRMPSCPAIATPGPLSGSAEERGEGRLGGGPQLVDLDGEQPVEHELGATGRAERRDLHAPTHADRGHSVDVPGRNGHHRPRR